MNRQFTREWLIGTIIALMLLGVGTVARAADEVTVRWDILSFISPNLYPGGVASATAPDNSVITLTGSGAVQIEDGEFSSASGGGTWETHDASNVVTGSGTYRVRGVVVFTPAPGTLPSGLIDNIGNAANSSSGLMVLRIAYSDGSRGIVIVNCHQPVGAPDSIMEGITATKGFVNFSKQGPAVPGVNANRTLFHIQAAD
jgi:hypothetical protein